MNDPDHIQNGRVRITHDEIEAVKLKGFVINAAVPEAPRAVRDSFWLVKTQVDRHVVLQVEQNAPDGWSRQ